jgi:dimethylargininase
MREPATLEGGDVLRMGRAIFVGESSRTNAEGIRQLAAVLEPLGYSVHAVKVRGCLHLKSACCPLGQGAILSNRDWVDATALDAFEIVEVPRDEPRAANVLALGDTVIVPECFPETARTIKGLGLKVRPLDISELMKAEAGLTCSSILLEV